MLDVRINKRIVIYSPRAYSAVEVSLYTYIKELKAGQHKGWCVMQYLIKCHMTKADNKCDDFKGGRDLITVHTVVVERSI